MRTAFHVLRNAQAIRDDICQNQRVQGAPQSRWPLLDAIRMQFGCDADAIEYRPTRKLDVHLTESIRKSRRGRHRLLKKPATTFRQNQRGSATTVASLASRGSFPPRSCHQGHLPISDAIRIRLSRNRRGNFAKAFPVVYRHLATATTRPPTSRGALLSQSVGSGAVPSTTSGAYFPPLFRPWESPSPFGYNSDAIERPSTCEADSPGRVQLARPPCRQKARRMHDYVSPN